MFRLKTTRRAKRAISPIRPATDVPVEPKQEEKPVENVVVQEKSDTLEKQMVNFFEAESAAVSLSKPWLRLERGLRLQKYRAFAESYPGLNKDEKESLYKVLMRANDAKLLNTKQYIQYENGIIQSVKGLKVMKTGDPNMPATFKIETLRSTKKNVED
jgi:hypothetical protein